MLYFGYGSNLCSEDLDRWCRTRGLAGIGLTRVAPAFLPDRRLAFTHRSTTRGGGVLDVPPARGCAVSGVLFRVDGNETFALLDRKEGDGHAYRRIVAVTLTEDGGQRTAVTYEVEPRGRGHFVAPSPSYFDVVRRGHEEHGLFLEPLVAAARDEEHRGPVAQVFVYGTLRRGEERHAALARHRTTGGGVAFAPGTLLDLGPYPGLVPGGPGAAVVGELYAPPDPGALFTELDTVETFRGFGVPGSLYRRAILSVRRADGEPALAWTYVYAGSRSGSRVIASGDWRRRQEPRIR
jgi:gamma-glutamylcyclotransferase (GGCT)/AIG2-like uncharacterized protein YtfP